MLNLYQNIYLYFTFFQISSNKNWQGKVRYYCFLRWLSFSKLRKWRLANTFLIFSYEHHPPSLHMITFIDITKIKLINLCWQCLTTAYLEKTTIKNIWVVQKYRNKTSWHSPFEIKKKYKQKHTWDPKDLFACKYI